MRKFLIGWALLLGMVYYCFSCASLPRVQVVSTKQIPVTIISGDNGQDTITKRVPFADTIKVLPSRKAAKEAQPIIPSSTTGVWDKKALPAPALGSPGEAKCPTPVCITPPKLFGIYHANS